MIIDQQELRERLGRLRALMVQRGHDSVLVYGDEKHYENVKYLTGFDPRFESALVVVNHTDEPVVITGVESIAVFRETGRLGSAIPFLPFSIQGMTGDYPADLEGLLRKLGLGSGSRIGLVGERSFSREHFVDPSSQHFFPHFIWRAACAVAGDPSLVRDCTDVMVDKAHGLRARKSAKEIIVMEQAAVVAARGVAGMLDAIRPGMTELDLMAEGFFAGRAATFAFHPTVVSGERATSSLLSPSMKPLQIGEPVSIHYGPTVDGYCGNIDRLGLLAAGPEDLPPDTRDIVEVLYRPTFEAYVAMLRTARIGLTGGALFDAVIEPLRAAGLSPDLNAGHLIGLAEWEDAYTTPESSQRIESGHVMQVDLHVLTLNERYGPGRIQEGMAYADASLRRAIQDLSPATWGRIQDRRVRLASKGIDVHETLLPLSDLAPLFRPYLLDRSYSLTPSPALAER